MARDGTKTGGRAKGSLNKKTIEEIDRAARILDLIESKYLEKDIKALSPNQRVLLYSDMMEYKAPKLSRTELTGKNGKDLQPKPVLFVSAEKLTEQQIDKLISNAGDNDESI